VTGPDSLGVRAALAGAGETFSGSAAAAAKDLETFPRPPLPSEVALLAGARSAPACEALVGLLGDRSPVAVVGPMLDRLAAHVGPGTLVVACSLSPSEHSRQRPLVEHAMARGADVLLVGPGGRVTLLGGGPVPVGMGADQAAPSKVVPEVVAGLVELLPALVEVSIWAGLMGNPGLGDERGPGEVAAAISVLRGARAELEVGREGLHERLARRIGRTIPLVQGTSGLAEAAARSWKRSWNLVAKAPAIASCAPLVALEEVSGLGQHGDVTRQMLTLVNLHMVGDEPLDVERCRLVGLHANEALAAIVDVEASGDGPLAQLVHLEWLGLASALAAAAHEGIDPGPLVIADDIDQHLDDVTGGKLEVDGRGRVCG